MIRAWGRLKLFFWTKIAERKFSHMPFDTCCCGLSIDDHSILENHQPFDMKNYVITKYVQSKMNRR